MSHVVLARKYRPRSFEQMVGQEHVVQALTNALQSGRLHHAYLFTGTRGIGKTTVSRILAKSLNCTGPDGSGGVTAHPCGVCQACTEIDADRYIDYIELDAASNRSIDEIRDLIERAAYKPSVGRFKVFMIDEAHQLTKDAFNALLKTLEEPPDYLKFVLATTDPDKMLPTVLSRCLQFNLRPMAPEVVRAHLQDVLQAEGVQTDAGALRLLARAARGSMRDALSLADQAIAYGAGRLDEAGVRAMLGSVDRSHVATLVRSLAARDGAAVLDTVAALRTLGLSAAGALEALATLLQQMAIEQAVPGALDDDDVETAGVRELAATMPADETQLLYSIALHGRAELSLVSDEYAALTMVLLRLLAFPAGGEAPAQATPVLRAAPLQATPRQARATAPLAAAAVTSGATAPATLPPRRASPAMAPAGAAPRAASKPDPVAALSTAAGPAAPTFAAAPPPRAAAAHEEPPPWVDDPGPDAVEIGNAAEAHVRAGALPTGVVAANDDAAPVRTPLGDRWSDAVRPLIEQGAVAALVRELALQAELRAVEDVDGICWWRLRVERETLRAPALRDKLQAVLQSALAQPLRLEVEPGAALDSIARRDAAERAAAQQAAEQVIRDDPFVHAVMAQFGSARIVAGSIKPMA